MGQNAHAQLRAWLERTGRSYPDVSTALKISQPHLSHLLNGGRTPSLILASRIQIVTGIPMSEWAPKPQHDDVEGVPV